MRFWLWSLLLGALFAPGVAQAWTDAHVREAQATVALDVAQQRAAVTLDLSVEVRGGWLERLDLTGLDDGLVAEPVDAAYALLESGAQVPGKLSLKGALASVHFQRKDGLRRGVHHVVLRYSAPLAQIEVRDGGEQRVAWTLPGWESGLVRAVIELRGLGALRPVPNPEVPQEIQRGDAVAGTALRFTRVHVPRASPWTVAVDVAPASFGGGAAGPRAAGPLELSDGPAPRTGAALGFGLFMLALLRRALRRRDGARTWLGPMQAGALAALGALCWVYALPVALMCWSVMSWGAPWQRDPVQRPLPLGRLLPLHAPELARLRRRALRASIGVPGGELVSVCGALELSLVMVSVAVFGSALNAPDPWGLGVLCAPLGAIAGSRWWQARDAAEQVRCLLRAAQRSRLLACGMSLCAYVADGKPYHPRLRLWPGVRYPGLMRLEVLVHPRRDATPLWLSAEVEPGSPAARWLRELWPDLTLVHSAQGQRLWLRRPIENVGVAAEQLLEHLGRQSQRCLDERAPARAA